MNIIPYPGQVLQSELRKRPAEQLICCVSAGRPGAVLCSVLKMGEAEFKNFVCLLRLSGLTPDHSLSRALIFSMFSHCAMAGSLV